jgi:hypothetical protein
MVFRRHLVQIPSKAPTINIVILFFIFLTAKGSKADPHLLLIPRMRIPGAVPPLTHIHHGVVFNCVQGYIFIITLDSLPLKKSLLYLGKTSLFVLKTHRIHKCTPWTKIGDL